MDRRETVSTFRDRMIEVLNRSGLNRSAFARKVGVERSTLSQLLSHRNDRLPRIDTIAAIAATERVSVDWLLGLSQEGHLGADIVSRDLEIEPGGHAPVDERLMRWHSEAVGYKIRHVPANLPDVLKSDEIIRYEYQGTPAVTPEQRIEVTHSSLDYQRRPETDMEVCSAYQTVEGFVRGEGMWQELAWAARRAQLRHMIDLTAELYPTFRWFLFDGRQRYAAPITVFGPQRAAVYMGHMYFVFNSTEHIRVLTRHFDDLIRAAVIHPPDLGRFLHRLLRAQEKSCAGDKSRTRR